jgi:hypothetical protein
MKTLILADQVSAAATSTQTAIRPLATPFLAGRDAVWKVDASGITGTPTILLEGSVDGVTYTTNATCALAAGSPGREFNVKVQPYNRTRVSVAGSAGVFSSSLRNGT